MARSHRHIKQYEKELLELKAKAISVKEIGERFSIYPILSIKRAHVYTRAQKQS